MGLQAVERVLTPSGQHWVGDGFWVTTVFSPSIIDAQTLSPFVLMDHAGPRHFAPAPRPRGVGEHPHRGFETVTFAYQGEIEHRDSHGGGGLIGPGDVQWMTAAKGVVHEEFHSHEFTKSGGTLEMVQLWVNLPANKKMSSPRYQRLPAESFPVVELGRARARLIAGSLLGKRGPGKTHTPITVFDLEFSEGGEASFSLANGTTTLLMMLRGDATLQGEHSLSEGSLAVLDRSSPGRVELTGRPGTRVLVLNGEPLEEPVVARGPFVMNTQSEIAQAIRDYQAGTMGQLAPKETPWES